jgi:hypothetical protein
MLDWLLEHRTYAMIAALIAVLVIWRIVRRGHRAWRRSRPPRLNPRLQKYAGAETLDARRRGEAGKIEATSTTPEIAGYRTIEQVDAVFVDGFARPEEAMEGLKASAALKGANALVNVRQERTGPGRYAASGDGVRIGRIPTPTPPEPEDDSVPPDEQLSE